MFVPRVRRLRVRIEVFLLGCWDVSVSTRCVRRLLGEGEMVSVVRWGILERCNEVQIIFCGLQNILL